MWFLCWFLIFNKQQEKSGGVLPSIDGNRVMLTEIGVNLKKEAAK